LNKKILYVAGGILVIGGAAVGFLYFLPGGTFFDAGPVVVNEAAPPPPPPGMDLGPIKGSGGSAIVLTVPGPEPTYEPPPPPPPSNSWEAVKPVARPRGPVGAAVTRGLNEMKEQLDACFDEDVAARHGGSRVSRTQDNAPIEDSQTTILMLQVETHDGFVRIADAPVESQGPADEPLIACAQRILRGLEVDSPEVKAGERHRILFTLSR
jgi:hypothetical protein